VSSFTIDGAGGKRAPVSPVSRRTGAQEPSSIAANLLGNGRHRENEILIEIPPDRFPVAGKWRIPPRGKPPAQPGVGLKRALEAQYGVAVRDLGSMELMDSRLWVLTLVPGQELQTVLAQLLQDNRILSAQPNYVYAPVQERSQSFQVLSNENDRNIRMPAIQLSGAGVKIAIIDTCADLRHAEFEGMSIAFHDATAAKARDCRPEYHGTAVTSLIGGHRNINGAAPGATLMQVRAFAFSDRDNEIVGTTAEVAVALDWAGALRARVANLSFAGPSDPLVERVAAAAYRTGMVLIAAAGNAGPSSPPLYPAAYPEVIGVTATDGHGMLYEHANRGPHIAVAALGVEILAAHPGGNYGIGSGTSFAAATVSGIVALILEKAPNSSPEQVRSYLRSSASGLSGGDERAGFGVISAKATVSFLQTEEARR